MKYVRTRIKAWPKRFKLLSENVTSINNNHFNFSVCIHQNKLLSQHSSTVIFYFNESFSWEKTYVQENAFKD